MKDQKIRFRVTFVLRFLAAIALVLISSSSLLAATVTATWDQNTESNISGYILSYGTSSRSYTTTLDVGNVTSRQLTLNPGRYYFAVQARNTNNQTSPYSTEVVFDVGVVTPPAPSLTSLSPTSGSAGTSVTINGSNFGTTQGTSTVRFNGATASVTSWSASSIVATVPSGATSGSVVVSVGGVASNGLSFSVTAPPSLPSPWTSRNIGSPALSGTASYASGTFTVSGSGTDIWDVNDQFNFVYQPLNGNGEIVARVGSIGNTDVWAKAGVMIREDLTGGARHVMSLVSAASGFEFQRRLTPGAIATGDYGMAGAPPQWIRLVRSGNTFTGYYSSTGSGWTSMGTVDVAMATQVYIGLAVTSHNVGALTTATINNVTVTSGSSTPPAPSITSLSPTSGPVGASVTISGANFGSTQGTSTVRFNGTTATPTNWGASGIVAPVPSGATTGSVVVTVNGVASNGSTYTVTTSAPPAPAITSLSPTSGPVGTSVTISGANFGSTQGTSTVRFNGTTATPTSWGASSIVAPVPSGATTGSVVVTVNGVASNGSTYTVTTSPPAPAITSLSPTSGPVGTSVTISGVNFGSTQGTSTVRFNGTTATPTSWGASSIVASVPTGATSGNVVVTVGGVASGGSNFTVTTSSGLPAPWTSQNIGSPALSGTASYGSGTFTVSGSGTDIWDANDQFNFVYQPLNGNGEIVARVGSIGNTDVWAKAGVMIREDLTGGARHVMSLVSAASGFEFQRRLTPGAIATGDYGMAGAPPQWIRLVRSGNTFTGYYSSTGSGWTSMGTVDVAMATQVYIGLAVTSHNVGALTTATINNVTVTSGSSTPPAPSITSLSPTTGAVGTSVTISGANFGSTQGTSTVRFNGTTATPTSWGASSIAVPVPSGASTGPVVVTVNGQTSNGQTFTLATMPGTITLRQDRQIDAGVVQSQALSFNASVTSGSLVAVVARSSQQNQTYTVTDTRGNTYRQAAKRNGWDNTVAIYYAENTSGGSNTVTVTQGTASYLRLVILEFAGVATSNALDVAATNTGSSTTPSAAVTTTTAGGLLVGAIASTVATTVTAGSGYTIAEAVASAPNTKLMAEWMVQSGSGSTSARATLGSSSEWAAAIAAFKPASAGGGSLMTLSSLDSSSAPLLNASIDVGADSSASAPGAGSEPVRAPIAGDYDGDGKADPATYRPSAGQWRVLTAASNYTSGLVRTWGTASDVRVPGDYDGDGKADLAYYRPTTGSWSILLSSTGLTQMLDLVIGAGGETPVPADYDGDGATDVAVYDNKTGQWRVLTSGAGFGSEILRNWGSGSDVPVPGDYDGDGKADPAVYSPATGEWKIELSGTDYAGTMSLKLGNGKDVPVPADFDGDGTTDAAVFQPSSAEWRIMRSDGTTTTLKAGASGTPVALDYDGDGKADLAVFQGGVWHLQLSSVDYAPALSIDAQGNKDVPLTMRP